ncbi:hypothetical protein DENSPDRAFT_781724 [Dentipellis sp. KUC8613]|nr:hypothetical protein DENSPDRAFT_781724 [Dentipellis sp. KUC8613]
MSQADPSIHPQLQKQLNDLQNVAESIAVYEPYVPKPPILDASIDAEDEDAHNRGDTLPGLRTLSESIKRDIELIQKFLKNPNAASLNPPSTNAPYLLAVWEEVLRAPQPVVAIGKTFFARSPGKQTANGQPARGNGSHRSPGVKVDVVSENGKSWVRVNTTKNSRLLVEFREIDSYDTDSDDSLDVDRPSLAQTEFDNSILRMGRALLAAAHSHPLPGTSLPPNVTFRFTRLHPAPATDEPTDPRIGLTLDMLRAMGIDVQLRGADEPIRPPPRPRKIYLAPTRHVNLDLSILIALVSDLTHTPLPPSAAAARARFFPNASYLEWKKSRLRARIMGLGLDDADSDGARSDANLEDGGEHSRALADQLQQEMVKGLLQDMHERLRAESSDDPATQFADVQFWTTAEARDRFLRIVAKIGGANEKRRAYALFGQSSSAPSGETGDYWEHSRYPANFIPLPPVHVFSPSSPISTPTPHDAPLPPFFTALTRTCRALLSLSEETPPPRGAIPDALADTEIQRAAVTKANPKLTAHTVRSVLAGAARGWTTMTANRASVKALVREVRKSGAEMDCGERGGGARVGEGEVLRVDAAIWVVDPRSLAEGMRADYEG